MLANALVFVGRFASSAKKYLNKNGFTTSQIMIRTASASCNHVCMDVMEEEQKQKIIGYECAALMTTTPGNSNIDECYAISNPNSHHTPQLIHLQCTVYLISIASIQFCLLDFQAVYGKYGLVTLVLARRWRADLVNEMLALQELDPRDVPPERKSIPSRV